MEPASTDEEIAHFRQLLGDVLGRMDQLEGRQGMMEITVNELSGGLGKLQTAIKALSVASTASATAPSTTASSNSRGSGDRAPVTQGELKRVSAAVLETAETLAAMIAGVQRDFVYVVDRERDAFRSVREQLDLLGAGAPFPQGQLDFLEFPRVHGPQNQQDAEPQSTVSPFDDAQQQQQPQPQPPQHLLGATELDNL